MTRNNLLIGGLLLVLLGLVGFLGWEVVTRKPHKVTWQGQLPARPAPLPRPAAPPDPPAHSGGVVYEEELAPPVQLPSAPVVIANSVAVAPRTAPPPPPPHAGEPAEVAIIIDDLGYVAATSLAIARMEAALTLAIVPDGRFSSEVARIGGATHKEIIIHQPMEPLNLPPAKVGPAAIFTTMSSAEIKNVIRASIARLPQAVGMNNHMGSRFTTDPAGMRAVIEELALHHMFFVDSRTAPGSVGLQTARDLGVPRAKRDIFLDNQQDVDYILGQLHQLEKSAHAHGAAVGIGHPYPETVAALESWLGFTEIRGIRIVPVSRLLEPVSARSGESPVVAAR